MAFSVQRTQILIIAVLALCGLCLVRGLQGSGLGGRSLIIKPPTDLTRKDRGGGGEYGIRQIDQKEVSKLVVNWTKKLRVPGGDKLEIFEMLQLLETVSLAMPGKAPQRNEFVAFADFVDGNIECVSALYLTKVACPWEADVLLICQCPKLQVEKTHEMIEFIDELCMDNACLPNYDPLEQHDVLMRQYRSYKKSKSKKAKKVEDGGVIIGSSTPPYNLMNTDFVDKYKDLNKGRCVCLDNFPSQTKLGPYWYRVTVKHGKDPQLRLPVYLRQRHECLNEFQISFEKPETGVESGRGTVGGALVLNRKNAFQIVPCATDEVFATISSELTARLKHPPIDADAVATTKQSAVPTSEGTDSSDLQQP